MGRVSIKENKTEYQIFREELGYSREKASELLGWISPERIEKIENEKSLPHPDEVLAMSVVYQKPRLKSQFSRLFADKSSLANMRLSRGFLCIQVPPLAHARGGILYFHNTPFPSNARSVEGVVLISAPLSPRTIIRAFSEAGIRTVAEAFFISATR